MINSLLLIVFLALYFYISFPVFKKAFRNIKRKDFFDENFLMCIASIGSLILGEYLEGFAVLALYRIGEYLQYKAVGKSRKSIAELMDIRPDIANIEQDGKIISIDPEKLQKDQIIIIKPGERIPADSIIIKGNCSLDVCALTGESLPKDVKEGDEIYSGSIDLNGIIYAKVLKPAEESTAARILELVEDAAANRAKQENFITRFAHYYTPAVCTAALILALLPPLLGLGTFSLWVHRALTFLVVSCPCALIISIPLGFFAGIGRASSLGILMKGGNYLENLSKIDTLVFDKTGTLTKGSFKVSQINPKEGISKKLLLEKAALAEQGSNHPISKSLQEALENDISEKLIDFTEIAGKGILAKTENSSILCGNASLMKENHIDFILQNKENTIVYVAENGNFLGSICISDEIKENAKIALEKCRKLGVKRTVMLTGDKKEIAEKTAKTLNLNAFYAELLPEDKLSLVKSFKKDLPEKKILAFVGDGINDAPVLAGCDLGLAMGAMGSAAAVEAADVVLMKDSLEDIPLAIKIAKKTMRIIYEDIYFSIGVKFLVLILAGLGLANMWLAIFADVGVCMLAILNSMRALKIDGKI